ncbi:DUF5068 domain-containing protein [Oceanobacillus piezotolerans]|uniref:DUF5068 domain-containing protein n=1 Tax=Oceanobacillus piezotolerans TaxID=2448030 RepID=A0A498D950_9BACI|nr:DUF5068 domain-containing protein [Oceanobacillus piezotolerans]RLL47823.1 DUF5068 domain-containing protein [Oceanobacillus piezotolerans]
MKRRLLTMLVTMLFAVLLISGCGSETETPKEEEVANAAESTDAAAGQTEEQDEDAAEEASNEEEKEDTEENTDAANDTANSSSDFSELISFMEEETEGTTSILYENDEPQVHTTEAVSVSLDSYKLIELNDFHTDYSIPFNDETNGGVIIAQYTISNEMDKDVYYMPAFYLSFTGAQKAYNNYKDLLPEDDQIPTMLNPSDGYLLEAGESMTGFYTYPFGAKDLKTVLDESTAVVEVPAAQAEKDDFGSTIGKDGKFTLSLSEQGAEKVEANQAFYQDKVTSSDMGEKKMLEEKDGTNESEELGDVTVTLDGYQFTEFTPNEVEAPRFVNFTNGMVLLTVKFNLDNKGSEAIGLSSTYSKLTMNDGTQYTLNEGMLLDYSYDDVIPAGESGEFLQLYILDQEQYEKIWKDKAFEVEVGPMKNEEAKDISKGKTAIFNL